MRTKLLAIALILAAAGFARVSPADLNLKDLEGRSVHLRDYRGKPVVLNFWATWCVPCNDEMPLLVEEKQKWTARGVVFIAASLDDRKTRSGVPDFLRKFHVDFPVWVGAGADDLGKLGMGEAVPATAFLDETGVIFARVQGEIKRPELEERLEWVTGDRKGAPPKILLHNL